MPTIEHDHVARYYRDILQSNADLKTKACCNAAALPEYLRAPISLIHEDVLNKFYGCGVPVPMPARDARILDLGCGTGRDCFLLAYLAGEEGEVIGVDMLPEQLAVAKKHLEYHIRKFQFKKSNIQFIEGYIENLQASGIKENYFDIAVSNCVVNLSPDKRGVLSGVYRSLKEGGEFFFSDVYVDRRLPDWARKDPLLLGECLGGALYWKDFERLARETGFLDPRVVTISKIDLASAEIIDKVGFANFYSITYRLFKLPALEDACEDYGQLATYRGGIIAGKNSFALDDHHIFHAGMPTAVCGNTAAMLTQTRFNPYFTIQGDRSTHRGIFAGCANPLQAPNARQDAVPGCC